MYVQSAAVLYFERMFVLVIAIGSKQLGVVVSRGQWLWLAVSS